MTQRTDLLEVLSELVDAIEPYAQSHKFDTPCDCCLCTAIANAEVALASHAPSETPLPQVVLDSPICDICGHHSLDDRFHHAPGSQGNMQVWEPSEPDLHQELAQLQVAYQKAIACVPTELLNLYFKETQ